ncbi:Hypothetical predicted protein [Lecanosticta acicola]|uniref:Uncharacterized protein n=1 Tax=Lecanosticta acicola TaxID=111012 RepID=A0AAI8Z6Y2_9PEZI|nr:Hypothetical predicted protein [Lecanosticta acicola]
MSLTFNISLPFDIEAALHPLAGESIEINDPEIQDAIRDAILQAARSLPYGSAIEEGDGGKPYRASLMDGERIVLTECDDDDAEEQEDLEQGDLNFIPQEGADGEQGDGTQDGGGQTYLVDGSEPDEEEEEDDEGESNATSTVTCIPIPPPNSSPGGEPDERQSHSTNQIPAPEPEPKQDLPASSALRSESTQQQQPYDDTTRHSTRTPHRRSSTTTSYHDPSKSSISSTSTSRTLSPPPYTERISVLIKDILGIQHRISMRPDLATVARLRARYAMLVQRSRSDLMFFAADGKRMEDGQSLSQVSNGRKVLSGRPADGVRFCV